MKVKTVVVLACSVSLAAACGTPGGRPTGAGSLTSRAVTLAVPYRSAGAGFGGSGSSDVAVVPSGKHATYLAALCLQGALEKFNAQLRVPAVLELKESDTDIAWRSDIGPLTAKQMSSYNESSGTHPPLINRLFGVQFAGRLRIVDNELRFSIEARLSGRGAGESWRELPETDYEGAFFSRQLAATLKENLIAHSKAP
jgi:hypothetical protein